MATDPNEPFTVSQAAVRGAIDEAVESHTKLEIVSKMNDWSLGAKRERGIFFQSINDYVKVTTNHLIKLKTHQNTLVAINRLPIELFTCIILFAKLPTCHLRHPFLSYTWVCHHWRLSIIQDPQFWTAFQVRLGLKNYNINPFIHELLQRSNRAKLYAELSINISQSQPLSTLKDLVSKASNRISRMWLSADEPKPIHSVFLKTHFPSLRAVNYVGRSRGLVALLPVLHASDQLDTLQCTLGLNFSASETSQLLPVLSRLRFLSLTIHQSENLEIVSQALHNNDRLLELQLIALQLLDRTLFNRSTLPELRSLSVNESCILGIFRTPKLSGLDVGFYSGLDFVEDPNFEFDFASINCLYICDSTVTGHRFIHFIGVVEPIHATPLFSRKTAGFTKDTLCFEDIRTKFIVTDITLHSCPRDYFAMKISINEVSDNVLDPVLLSILHRLSSLTELYLLSRCLKRLKELGITLHEVLRRAPNVEKLVIQYDDGPIKDFIHLLSDPSACPRLKHISYTLSHSAFKDPGPFDESDVGTILVDCLQSRQKVLGDTLEFFALGNCLPLSDTCLEELKHINTTVIVETS